jgi:hypothetical protein
LLIEIAEQVEGLDADLGVLDPALQQAPEVLDAVSVHVAPHIGLSMIDDLVRILLAHLLIAGLSQGLHAY